MRWYLVTTAGAHPQAFCEPKFPQGQGCTQWARLFMLIQKEEDCYENISQVLLLIITLLIKTPKKIVLLFPTK